MSRVSWFPWYSYDSSKLLTEEPSLALAAADLQALHALGLGSSDRVGTCSFCGILGIEGFREFSCKLDGWHVARCSSPLASAVQQPKPNYFSIYGSTPTAP